MAERSGFISPRRRYTQQGFTSSRRYAQQGFTLIEVMVALAVFALAVLALVRLEGATLRGVASVDDTLAASMLARSLAAEAVADARAPTLGTSAGSQANGGRDWRWTRTVEPTGDSRILRIDVAVTDARGVQRGTATLVRSSVGQAAR